MSGMPVRVVAAALALLVAGSGAPGYLVRRSDKGVEYSWDLGASAPNKVGGKITFYVDQSSVPGGSGITGAQFAAAVRAALQSWEDVGGSAVAFSEDGARSTTQKDSSDRINRFGFTGGVLPPFAFASAFTMSSNNRITDVDVIFNPDLPWSATTPPDAQSADTQGVATHEWGHGLGFDHIPLSHSTMYWAASYGAQSLRTPEADDRAAAAHSYPAASAAADFATLRGRVDVAGTTNDRGVLVSVIDFLTGLPAVSVVSLPDGTWEMQWVPPGVYRLVASPLGSARMAGGTYSGYWQGSATTFFPAVRGQDGASDGSTGVLVASAGETLQGLNMSVGATDPSGEPNDAQGQAHGIAIGQSIGGREGTNSDSDWFSFPATSGQVVSVYLHAEQLGSELDGRLYLRRPNGTIAAQNRDIAGTQADYTSADGHDLDARILDFAVDQTGTWFIQVDPETPPDPSFPEDGFYVLTLLPGGGTPSALTSTLAASPAVLAANGSAMSTLTFTPRSLTGSPSGTGQAVTMSLVADGNPDGALSGVTDHGDGTYTATLTAPASAGSDVVRALVTGTPMATATVNYRGPAAFAASDFYATPGRIRPDGASQATVVLVPRDANGLSFGAGHAVTISLAEDPAASLGPTSDAGDGSYTATLTAGAVREVATLEATVDGAGLGGTTTAQMGFPFEDVLDDARAGLAAYLAGAPSPPPEKSVAKIQSAVEALDGAAAIPFPSRAADAVKFVGKAVKSLESAAKKGAEVSALARALAEAAREAAQDSIAAAAPHADEVKEQAALAKAQALFAAGDALLDAGLFSKAIAKYGAAFKQTALVHPF